MVRNRSSGKVVARAATLSFADSACHSSSGYDCSFAACTCETDSRQCHPTHVITSKNGHSRCSRARLTLCMPLPNLASRSAESRISKKHQHKQLGNKNKGRLARASFCSRAAVMAARWAHVPGESESHAACAALDPGVRAGPRTKDFDKAPNVNEGRSPAHCWV